MFILLILAGVWNTNMYKAVVLPLSGEDTGRNKNSAVYKYNNARSLLWLPKLKWTFVHLVPCLAWFPSLFFPFALITLHVFCISCICLFLAGIPVRGKPHEVRFPGYGVSLLSPQLLEQYLIQTGALLTVSSKKM